MGLFSDDGRDLNHDGYVSPFDADETQAYVDPSKSLDREHTDQERESPKPSTPQSAQPQRPSQTRQTEQSGQSRQSGQSGNHPYAPNPATRVDRSSTNQTSGQTSDQASSQASGQPSGRHAQPQQQTGRKSNLFATIALLSAIAAMVIPAVGSVDQTDFDRTQFMEIAPVATAVIALIAIAIYVRDRRRGGLVRAILALLCAAGLMSGYIETEPGTINVRNPLSGKHLSIPGIGSMTWDGDSQSSARQTRDTVIHDDQVELNGDDGVSGTFRIVSATRGPIDTFDRKPTVIVTYAWTNTGSASAFFQNLCSAGAFQHGVALDQTYLYPEHGDAGVPESYDRESWMVAVEPGATKNVTLVYSLADEQTPVEVWIGDYRFDDAVVRRFPVAGTVSSSANVPPTELAAERADDPIRSDATATDEDRAGMTTFETVWGDLHATILDAHRGAPSVGGAIRPMVVVRVAWINDLGRPTTFFYHFDLKASIRDVELTEGYADTSKEPDPQYDMYSTLRGIKPGILHTATIAFEAPDGMDADSIQDVQVTLTGSSSTDEKTISATLPIAQKVQS